MMKALLAVVMLLGVVGAAGAGELSSAAAQLPQPRDAQNRHWTARRFFTQFELQNCLRYRLCVVTTGTLTVALDADRLDSLEFAGGGDAAGPGGDAGSAAGSPGDNGCGPR